jgi:phospholipid/cholesterol/gamma-HCH transport system ATP-binding protein
MIEVRDLKKSFGTHSILDGVSFRIEKGESVVIIGRSGGGKSVLLKHLIGLLQPDAGQVLIEGENIVPMNERELLHVRRKFGMLFQSAALFDSMTVAENVGFAFRRDRSLPKRGNCGRRWPRCSKWWICPAPRTRSLPNCRAA